MLSVMPFMCDLDSDVPNTCTVYVTLACYHTCFASIDVGWIFIFARLPLYLKRKLTISRCVLQQPSLVNRWNGSDRIAHPIGSSIIDFRVNNNGSLPTRMRSLFSWNVNSWRTFDSNEYKLRRCQRLLRKGPVCLQETKWTGTEVEYLYQQIPGIRVCHSAAVCCGDRIRTGGVAVLLPPGWEILEQWQ